VSKTACIYARVSDRDRQGDNFSIPTQLTKMREVCVQQGWEVGYELSEKDSAYLDGLERAELNKARELAKEGKIDILLFFSPDRFTRDIGDGVILRRELRKHNVSLYCFTPHIHEITDDLEIMHILTDWQSQQYVEKLREASIRGVEGKIEMGLYSQGLAPYGYRLVGRKRDSHLEIEEGEAQIVIMIFELYVYGNMGSYEIAKRLNELHIPSNPKGKNDTWSSSKVRRILNSETYAGVWYAHRYQTVSKGKRERRPKEDGVPITVPAIVSRPIWQAAVDKLRTRQAGKGVREHWLMSCRIRCVCGISMCAVSVGDRTEKWHYHYYRCVSHRTAQGHCGAKQWKAEDVDAIVWDFAYDLLHNPDRLLEGYRNMQVQQEKERTIYAHQIDVLDTQIAEQEQVLADMLEQRNATRSKSVQSILDRQIEEYGGALDALIARRNSLSQTSQSQVLTDEEIAQIKEELAAIKQMLGALHTIDEQADITAKRALIEALNLKATLRTDEQGQRWVDIHWLRETISRKLHDQNMEPTGGRDQS
jgi:site-specific DNA recombinase